MVGERENNDWLHDLRSAGPSQEMALADLRALVVKNLPFALSRWLSPTDPRFEALTEEVAQETLLRVLDHLNTFEGRSRFTTWVYKISVRVALTELRRKRWENVSLDSLLEDEGRTPPPGLMTDLEPGPEVASEKAAMLAHLQQVILEELTGKQRQAMLAVVVKGMPMEEVARRMGTNRNALYKLLHDARLRIKQRIASEGMTVQDILAVFEGA
jgi:RNA polymerase sigma-70 factor, ECF subfamily